jgi:hypothetical protein
VEAGTGTNADGTPGVYAVVDGDNSNSDPTNSGDGYIGVSNYETGTKGTCPTTGPTPGTGSNSGGCFTIKNQSVVPSLPVPLLVCGNTSGPTWDNTTRDGCAVP